jgi:metal-sulfur cluster biosynthetic enzyme
MQTTQLETTRVTGLREPAAREASAPPAVTPSDGTGANAEANRPAALAEPLTHEQIVQVKDNIVAALCTVFDPEIPVNIYAPDGDVKVRMTLTSPACPAAGALPGEVERKVRAQASVTSAKVDVVFDPPWTKDRMSEAAKLQLGIDD